MARKTYRDAQGYLRFINSGKLVHRWKSEKQLGRRLAPGEVVHHQNKIINAMQFEREDVYIANIIKCRPPENRTPHKGEIEKCQSYLLQQLEMIKPRVIVTLGRVAADFFIRSSLGMTALRGNFHEFGNTQVMPTFHPSYLIRNEGNKTIRKMVWEDMQKVMAFLDKK